MSYNGSQGLGGNGTLLEISTGVSTWATVGESIDINPAGYEWKTDDATNLQSTAVERVATIQDGGTWEVTGNRVSTDAGQAAVAAAFASGAKTNFRVTLPKETGQTTSGDKFTFGAIVQKHVPSIKVDKIIKFALTLATSNGVGIAEGS